METVLIASWIEPELVDRIRRLDPRLRVLYEPQLLRPPRYPADHKGGPLERSDADERKWLECLEQATILFDFDQTHLGDLPEVAPNVRWIQATSSGIGQFVRRMKYDERMPDTVFTTARGVHARPLAEFVAMAMTMHARRGLHMIREQAGKSWRRFAGADLEGRTMVLVGLGAVGDVVARIGLALGMRIIAIRRRPELGGPAGVERVLGPGALSEVLPEAEFLVLVTPHTPETDRMVGAKELAALPVGAAVVNIGRGALIDEAALVDALSSGHVGGAYLDVFEEEPLPGTSPLWEMPNVLVSPHSASTSHRENERIVDLFTDNLGRWLEGRELRNVLDPQRLY